MDEDYYKLLGLTHTASATDIQKAYRKLARECHPDLHPDDKSAKEKFKKIQKAYDVLSDAEKREMYDRYGSAFESMGAGGPWTARGARPRGDGGFEEIDLSQLFGGQFDAGSGGGFGDIFRQFTQGTGGSRAAGGRKNAGRKNHRGADLTHELEIPFVTAIQGGKIAMNVKRPGGAFEKIEVRIPPGIESGQTVRCRGQGEPGGGIPGDLLLTIRVLPHRFYTRRDYDLTVRVPVTIAEAAIGAKVDLPTPWGNIALKVPAGSSSGKKLRIKGHGLRTPKVQGDLYAEISIQLPDSLDDAALQMIRELTGNAPGNPRAALQW